MSFKWCYKFYRIFTTVHPPPQTTDDRRYSNLLTLYTYILVLAEKKGFERMLLTIINFFPLQDLYHLPSSSSNNWWPKVLKFIHIVDKLAGGKNGLVKIDSNQPFSLKQQQAFELWSMFTKISVNKNFSIYWVYSTVSAAAFSASLPVSWLPPSSPSC